MLNLQHDKENQLNDLHSRLEEAYELHQHAENRLDHILKEKNHNELWKKENQQTLDEFKQIINQKEHLLQAASERNINLQKDILIYKEKITQLTHTIDNDNQPLINSLKAQVHKFKEQQQPLHYKLEQTIQKEKEFMTKNIELQSKYDRLLLENKRLQRSTQAHIRKIEFNHQAQKYLQQQQQQD